MAARLKGELDVVHVAASDATSPGARQTVEKLRQLTEDIGARWHEVQDDDPARAIAKFARRNQITQIVIGSSQRSRWQQLLEGVEASYGRISSLRRLSIFGRGLASSAYGVSRLLYRAEFSGHPPAAVVDWLAGWLAYTRLSNNTMTGPRVAYTTGGKRI